MAVHFTNRSEVPWRRFLYTVIFEAETPAGKTFDLALMWAILLSVATVMLESVSSVRVRYGSVLLMVEWGFTILFTIEYILRLLSVQHPLRYATSFFGVVDLLAVLPTYLSVIFPSGHYLLTIRSLRLIRIFRVLKLAEYVGEARIIATALRASRRKISVFLLAVTTLIVIIGSVMYVVEGEENGFTDIPTGVYWAVVTLTTVGYGDVSPRTPLGQTLASLVMIIGYGIIAVPTGIVTVEISEAARRQVSTRACPACSAEGHDSDAVHCKYCGVKL